MRRVNDLNSGRLVARDSEDWNKIKLASTYEVYKVLQLRKARYSLVKNNDKRLDIELGKDSTFESSPGMYMKNKIGNIKWVGVEKRIKLIDLKIK